MHEAATVDDGTAVTTTVTTVLMVVTALSPAETVLSGSVSNVLLDNWGRELGRGVEDTYLNAVRRKASWGFIVIAAGLDGTGV